MRLTKVMITAAPIVDQKKGPVSNVIPIFPDSHRGSSSVVHCCYNAPTAGTADSLPDFLS